MLMEVYIVYDYSRPMWALCTDRSPDWRPAGTKCLLASPGGVAERSESFKMMIAGGNHTVIKKLLSVARLMRGGDRLIQECSWMNGICFSFHHSTCCCRDFKRSPPLIRLFCQSVPKCRLSKNPASPRGKPRGSSRKLPPFNAPLSFIRRPGRQVGDPYNGDASFGLEKIRPYLSGLYYPRREK